MPTTAEHPATYAGPLALAITVERDPSLYEFILDNSDIFARDYCGAWAFGADHKAHSWLVYESEDGEGQEPTKRQIQLARAARNAGAVLPKGFYILDAAAVDRVISAGVKAQGIDFLENYDATSLDEAIQWTLLGEHRYG